MTDRCDGLAVSSPAVSGSVESEPRRSLWRGRLLLVAGIVLLGISLRSAVTGMSPFLPEIRDDLGMGASAATLLGMLPTLFFGAAGFAAPVVIRRTSLELTATVAMILAAAGLLGRSLLDSVPLFLALSAVALFGMGMGNVVGAPLVKKYFPDRPAPMLTTFALLMQAGATIPAILALPLAEAGGGPHQSAGLGVAVRAVRHDAAGCSSNRRPRALVTLRMVDQVGLPSADSAL